MEVLNIVVVGVGGQGLLTLARLLGEAAMARGFEALAAETHGMSQRGGSVIVHVRIGKQVTSPLIPRGSAHYIASTELLETARYLVYANRDTSVVTNDKIILPALPGVVKPVDKDSVLSWIKQRVEKLFVVRASDIAMELGSPQSTNMVVLGALTALLKDFVDRSYLEKRVASIGRGRIAQANLEAFRRGLEAMCRDYGVC